MAVHKREKESKRETQNSVAKGNLQYTINCLQVRLCKWILPGKRRGGWWQLTTGLYMKYLSKKTGKMVIFQTVGFLMAFFLPFGCIPLCVFYNNHAGIYFLVVVLGSGDGNERKVCNRRFLAEDESTLLSNRTSEGLDSSAVHSLSNSHLSRHKGYQNEENPVLALKEPSVYRLISSQPQNHLHKKALY